MKKTISIIIISLVVLLVAATITLALVPFTCYSPITEGYSLITVYKNSYNNQNTYIDSTEEYKKISELYEASLKQNILSTMFQGALGNKTELEKVSSSTVKTLLNGEDSGYFIEFDYNSEQTLVWEDEEYTYTDGKTEKVAKYTSLLLEVKNTDNFTETTVYVVNGSSYLFKITSLAQQSELFEYVNNLVWSGQN